MKRLIQILPMLAGLGLFAQSVPATLNYQGRLTDNTPAQAPITATVSMQFALYDAASGGTRLWQEPAADNTGVAVSVNGGVFNYLLGGTAPIPAGLFAGASSVRYLQITLDPAGTPEVLAPRQLISAAAYANLAENANSATTATTATTATNSTQLGGVAASGYLTTTGTAFDSARLGGTLASGWQKALATPACASGFLNSISADGSSSCGIPSITETDPKVGSLTSGRVPRWSGSTLVDGALHDTGTRIGLGTANPIAQIHVAGTAPIGLGSVGVGLNPAALQMQGRYAYVANANSHTLQIFDVSNPAAIGSPLSTTATGQNPRALQVQGRYAYVVAQGVNTLQIFDISNLGAPGAAVGAATTGDMPNDIQVQGRYAYVVNYLGNSLQVFDISKPAAIGAPLATVATGAGPYAVKTLGRYAYVLNYGASTLQVFDISNPAVIGAPVGSTATDPSPMQLEIQGRYAYVICSDSRTLQVFDISNPAAIGAPVGSAATGLRPTGLQVQGRHAYVLNLFGDSLQVFDISNPAAIGVAASTVATVSRPNALKLLGRHAFVLSGNPDTLQAFDLGGGYLRQIESDGVETGTLAVRSTAQFGGHAEFRGGVAVGNGGILSTGSIASTAGFSGPATGLTAFPPNVALLSGAQTFTGEKVFSNVNNIFYGAGYGITELNADELINGTLPNDRLAGTYTWALTFNNSANSFSGNGSSLTALNATSLTFGVIPSTARLPLGGAWTLGTTLNIGANTLVADPDTTRVGIGTATPAAALDVAGDARVSGKLSTAANLGNTTAPAIGDRYRDNGVIAWARVASTGLMTFDFGVASVTHPATGTYTFTLDNSAASSLQLIPMASAELGAPPTSAASLRITTINQLTTNTFSVYINDGTGAPVDNNFVVIVTGR